MFRSVWFGPVSRRHFATLLWNQVMQLQSELALHNFIHSETETSWLPRPLPTQACLGVRSFSVQSRIFISCIQSDFMKIYSKKIQKLLYTRIWNIFFAYQMTQWLFRLRLNQKNKCKWKEIKMNGMSYFFQFNKLPHITLARE